MKRERLFLDTEFTELSQAAQLISLGIVAESGKSFYAEFTDFDPGVLKPWHWENIITYLDFSDKAEGYVNREENLYEVKGSREYISHHLGKFFQTLGPVECWLDYVAYDWVLFCDLFGGSMHLPKNLYYIPYDLMTLLKLKGMDPDISREEFVKNEMGLKELPQRHHALGDAKLLRLMVSSLLPTNLPIQ